MDYAWIVLGGGLAVWTVATYRRFAATERECDQSWGQVETQLDRRHALVGELLAGPTAGAGAEVTRACQSVRGVSVVRERAVAENALTAALQALGRGPAATAVDQELLAEIAVVENRVGIARQHYNDAVRRFNNMVQMFPGSLVAGRCGFRKRDYFEFLDPVRPAPLGIRS